MTAQELKELQDRIRGSVYTGPVNLPDVPTTGGVGLDFGDSLENPLNAPIIDDSLDFANSLENTFNAPLSVPYLSSDLSGSVLANNPLAELEEKYLELGFGAATSVEDTRDLRDSYRQELYTIIQAEPELLEELQPSQVLNYLYEQNRVNGGTEQDYIATAQQYVDAAGVPLTEVDWLVDDRAYKTRSLNLLPDDMGNIGGYSGETNIIPRQTGLEKYAAPALSLASLFVPALAPAVAAFNTANSAIDVIEGDASVGDFVGLLSAGAGQALSSAQGTLDAAEAAGDVAAAADAAQNIERIAQAADAISTVQQVDNLVQAVEDENWLGTLTSVGAVTGQFDLPEQVGGQLADSLDAVTGGYLSENNLLTDAASALTSGVQSASSGEDFEGVLQDIASTYVQEGGGVGGQLEDWVEDNAQGVVDFARDVADPIYEAGSTVLAGVDDFVSENLPDVDLGGTGLESLVGPLVAAGSAIDDALIQPVVETVPVVEDIIREPIVTAGDIAQEAIIDPVVETAPVVEDIIREVAPVVEDIIREPIVSAGDVAQEAIIDPIVSAGDVAQEAIIDPIVSAGDVIQENVIDPVVETAAIVEDAVSEAIPSVDVPSVDVPSVNVPEIQIAIIEQRKKEQQAKDMRTTRYLFGDELFQFSTQVETPSVGRLFSGLI